MPYARVKTPGLLVLVAAGVVQAGGHGGDTAGPIVAALLRMGG